MLVEFFHFVASRAEVFAGVEFAGFVNEDFTNSSSHGKTAVGVDVDFANSALGGFAELFFGNTDCIGKFATVGVDDVNVFLGNGRRTVEHDGETGEFFHNGVEHVECQRRGNELAVGVAGALLGSELVCAVGSTDRDSEGVAACAGSEVDNFFGVGVGVVVGRNFVFNAGENAEFAFNSYIELVSLVNDFLCEGYVFFVGKVRAVDHYGRETGVDAAFAEFERITVVEVKNDLGMLPAEFFCIFYCALSHVAEKCGVGIVASAFRYLEDDGRFFFSGSFDDGLKLLHVVEVESGDSVSAFDGLGEHIASIHQAEVFVTYHYI